MHSHQVLLLLVFMSYCSCSHILGRMGTLPLKLAARRHKSVLHLHVPISLSQLLLGMPTKEAIETLTVLSGPSS